jgi:hypothetical protein
MSPRMADIISRWELYLDRAPEMVWPKKRARCVVSGRFRGDPVERDCVVVERVHERKTLKRTMGRTEEEARLRQ